MSSDSLNIPKLAAFSSNWQSACPWLRILAPAQAAGMIVTRCRAQNNTDIINDSDMVVILRDYPRFREAYNRIILTARAAGKPVIYHLDDLLYHMPERHPDYLEYRPIRSAILLAIIQANLVIVTTEKLRAEVSRFNKNVMNISNYLDDRTWHTLSKTKVNEDPSIIIGYMGTSGHTNDIQAISNSLVTVLDKFKGKIRFRSYGTNPGADLLSRSDVDWIQWNLEYEEFVDKFAQVKVDICIAPLANNRFNHCKSAIKFLEYSAKGVPCVYSALTPYSEVIKDGQNGFLATTAEDWETKLIQLIENYELRTQMGKRAQQEVEQNWLLNSYITKWIEVYNCASKFACPDSHLEEAISLADEWSNEIQKSLKEAEQLHSAFNSSRLSKLLEKWWRKRGFLTDTAG